MFQKGEECGWESQKRIRKIENRLHNNRLKFIQAVVKNQKYDYFWGNIKLCIFGAMLLGKKWNHMLACQQSNEQKYYVKEN